MNIFNNLEKINYNNDTSDSRNLMIKPPNINTTLPEFIHILSIKEIYNFSEAELNARLSKYGTNTNGYSLFEKRYLLIYNLYRNNHLDTTEIKTYGIENIQPAVLDSSNYDIFLNMLKKETHNIEDIFNLTEDILDAILISINSDPSKYTLKEKRYLVVSNYYKNNLLNTRDINIYGINNFARSVQNAVDYEEYQKLLKNPPLISLPPPIINPSTKFNPPVFNPPVINPSIIKPPPVFNPPVFNPPVINPPVFNPPVINPSMINPPVFNPPVINPSTKFSLPAVINPSTKFNPPTIKLPSSIFNNPNFTLPVVKKNSPPKIIENFPVVEAPVTVTVGECCICGDEMDGNDALDCTHYVCSTCASNLTEPICPICREPLTGPIITDKIYMDIAKNKNNDKEEADEWLAKIANLINTINEDGVVIIIKDNQSLARKRYNPEYNPEYIPKYNPYLYDINLWYNLTSSQYKDLYNYIKNNEIIPKYKDIVRD